MVINITVPLNLQYIALNISQTTDHEKKAKYNYSNGISLLYNLWF